MLKLVLDIPPKPSQGAKGMRIAGKPPRQFIQVYEPADLRAWKSRVATHTWAYMKKEKIQKLTGPIRIVYLEYQFISTQDVAKTYNSNILCGRQVYKPTSPDITDNLQKGFIDALKGILFEDDARIVETWVVRKSYGTKEQITLVIDQVTDMIVPDTCDQVIERYTKWLTETRPVIN